MRHTRTAAVTAAALLALWAGAPAQAAPGTSVTGRCSYAHGWVEYTVTYTNRTSSKRTVYAAEVARRDGHRAVARQHLAVPARASITVVGERELELAGDGAATCTVKKYTPKG